MTISPHFRDMNEQPVLRTTRLCLRALMPTDATRIQLLAGDQNVADTTSTIPHPYPDGAAETWIAGRGPDWDAGIGATFAIIDAAQDLLVGVAGLSINSSQSQAEVGYWIGVPYWGRGYATEAAAALITFAFDVLQLHRVEARHFSRNPASGRVMQKLGMTFEGVQRESIRKGDQFEDAAVYAVLAREWQEKTA
jgi:[ribosomal protein S5]-alanine N-acetyltransferase